VRQTNRKQAMLLAAFLAGSIAISGALTQSLQGETEPGIRASASAAVEISVLRLPRRSRRSPAGGWLRCYGDSGALTTFTFARPPRDSLIRFSYRVVDADKANILSSKNATPYLIDEKNGLALQIPQLEQVGQLRQVSTPHDGREYWMAFSNKGRTVKPGDHVTVPVCLLVRCSNRDGYP
jgi:hypothetical protein